MIDFRLIFALVASVTALAGCGGGSSASSQSALGPPPAAGTGGTLNVAWGGQITSLDVTSGQFATPTEQIYTMLFDTLTEERPGHAQVVPGLATSWSGADSDQVWTFQLRPAEFSNGTPVTAQDVVFTMNRDLNTKDAPTTASVFGFIKAVVATGPRTVVFHLAHPCADFSDWVAEPPLGVVPAAYYRRVGPKGFARAPIGSGPFRLLSYTPGQSLVFAPNAHYWEHGLPYATRVNLNYVPNDSTRMLAVRSGTDQIGVAVPFSQIPSLRKVTGVTIQSQTVSAEMNVFLSWKLAPLKSQAIRQALAYATPLDVINRVVFDGLAAPLSSQLGNQLYNNPEVHPYPYDVAKAEALMAASPYPHGFTLPILLVSSDTPSSQIAAILQQSWARIGVHVVIHSVDIGTFSTLDAQGAFSALLSPLGVQTQDVPAADEAAEVVLLSNHANFTYYDVPAVTRLATSLVTAVGADTQRSIYYALQAAWMQNPQGIPLVETPAVTLLASNVSGFAYTSGYYFDVSAVRVGK